MVHTSSALVGILIDPFMGSNGITIEETMTIAHMWLGEFYGKGHPSARGNDAEGEVFT